MPLAAGYRVALTVLRLVEPSPPPVETADPSQTTNASQPPTVDDTPSDDATPGAATSNAAATPDASDSPGPSAPDGAKTPTRSNAGTRRPRSAAKKPVPVRDSADAYESSPASFEGETRTVVVTGTRTEQSLGDTPIATDVQDRTAIEESGAENVVEALEETPGLQMQRGVGGTGFVMQGLDPKYTLILVDGQRVTGRVDGTIDLSRFPAEDIEQIEIVRGPGSVLYGADALAGTINLITRRPKKPWEAEAHSAYGSFNTLDLTGRVGHRAEHYSGSLSAGWHSTDGWDADPSNLTTTGAESRQLEVSSSQRVERGPFFAEAWGQYLQRTNRSIDALETGAVFDRVNRTETITTSLTPGLEWKDSRIRLIGSYSLWRDQFFSDQRNSDELDDSQDTFDHLVGTTLQYDQRLGTHQLTTGMDGQFEFLAADRIDPGDVDRQRYAVFAQDDWRPGQGRVAIVPGVRVDYDSLFGMYATPRLALMVQPTRKWRLRASYGRGYRAPTFREMYLLFTNAGVGYRVQGNPSLQPETSWSTHLSAQYFPWRWAAVSASVFDHRLSDTIVIDTLDDSTGSLTLFGYANIGNAQSRGVESTASVELGPFVRLDGSYTFTHTEDLDTGRALPGRARHRGTAGVRFSRPSWGTTLRVRSALVGEREFFVDSNDDDILESSPTPAYATLDVRLAQNFTRYLQAFVGVDNVLDAGNATDNPLVPRSYYGGLNVRY